MITQSKKNSRAANTAQLLHIEFSTTGTSIHANDESVTLNLLSALTTSSNTSPSNLGYTVDNNLLVGGIRHVGSLVASVAGMHSSEMIVVNQPQSMETRQKMAGYFAHKYWRKRGYPVPLSRTHPYFHFSFRVKIPLKETDTCMYFNNYLYATF